MIDNRKVGSAIAALRQGRNMTQQQLAAVLNVSHQAVSKWETGQALPDVQTQMEIANLFGVTMEQLLSGEIPEARLNGQPTPGEVLEGIGRKVKSVFDGIGNFFSAAVSPADGEAPVSTPEEESGAESGAEETARAADEPAEEEVRAGESPKEEDPRAVDFDTICRMAPFMSAGALEQLLEDYRHRLTPNQIARLAPFLSEDSLEKLIQNSDSSINWDSVRRLAPFLKKEVVDRLVLAAAKGEKYVKPAAEAISRAMGDAGRDFGKAMDSIGQEIGKNVNTAVKGVVKFANNLAKGVSDAFSDAGEAQDPLAGARVAVFRAAMEQGKWDWLSEHLPELKDQELRREIAEKACSQGMNDWAREHIEEFADTQAILEAMEKGNWSWLSGAVTAADEGVQRQVAAAAMQAGQWQWIMENESLLRLGDDAIRVAMAAYASGEKAVAIAIATDHLNEQETRMLAQTAVSASDAEFLAALSSQLDDSFLNDAAIHYAEIGNWDAALNLSACIAPAAKARLMQLAVESGKWEIIERADSLLR